jgi:primosomal protein N' (replication factor Y) (superfamily II helicase)
MSSLVLAEPTSYYNLNLFQEKWVEVLVDCPGIQGLYTYSIPSELNIESGDILSVPFGNQVIGGIAIILRDNTPEDLDITKIKEVEDIITKGFFPVYYWQLMEKVAQYYCTELMTVIRIALPPGLLGRSQRRIRLINEVIPDDYKLFCSYQEQQIISLLQSQKSGDYSSRFLSSKIKGANRAIKQLIKRGWIVSYLEDPNPPRPKLQKAVILVMETYPIDLTEKQREVFNILRHHGGELWLTELLQLAHTSTSVVNNLEKKGYVVIEERERLRLLQELHPLRDQKKILTESQKNALNIITNLDNFSEVLLHGVTGSGKTEIYLQAIEPILNKGKSALVLVPEIGLTPQLTDRFRARFGNKIAVYHSGLSDGERYDTWRQMLTGESQVVIGTRSAVFAPLPKLGIIILDEEHDTSFKQQQIQPTYHARNVAKWRAKLENCPLILGSATPSLETWINTVTSYQLPVTSEELNINSNQVKIHQDQLLNNTNSTVNQSSSLYLSLPERIQARPLPPVEIVDLRQELKLGNRSMFSYSLQNTLKKLKEKQQQGILFIPRRGHSTFVSCRTCGYVVECPHCDVSLSYHYTHQGATELLRCHYCNYSELHPKQCPECGSPYLKFFGSGTQKVMQELEKYFPELTCIRFDSDTTRQKGSHRHLLGKFERGEADLLVGTQMLTKGLDLEQVTLVGVIAADGLLHLSDYRASERAFQTLTQVAGRAGRGNERGKVIIQTYSPQHPVINAVKNHDYLTFVNAELTQREELNYPPYGRLILLLITGFEEENVQKTAEKIADFCIEKVGENWQILGPSPASIMRIANRYRWQILLKSEDNTGINLPNFTEIKSLCLNGVSLSIDVDPLNIN